MELSVLSTLLRLLHVKHLRFNGLKVKFDNYHQMVKNGFFTEIWIQGQTLILTLQKALCLLLGGLSFAK